jgi:NAD+ kinase
VNYLKLPQTQAQIALVYRQQEGEEKKRIKTILSQLIKSCENHHVLLGTAPEQKEIKGAPLFDFKTLTQSHLILSLGGDGTYLRANRLLKGHGIPILGIHLGTLGFLTPTRSYDGVATLKKAFEGKLVLLPRSQIQVDYRRNKKTLFKALALNDVVVERGQHSQLIPLSIHSGTEWVTDAKADGAIVSTSMGSTAYNLAVGGPLLHPEAKVFSLSLIAPHSLTVRPLVLPDQTPIKISIAKNSLTHDKPCGRLVIDGQIVTSIEAQDEVILSKAKKPHWLVRDPEVGNFKLLREKLNFGQRL